jgi:hypothetical protein
MTKKERIEALEREVAELKQAIALTKELLNGKQDKASVYQPNHLRHPAYPSTNPAPPWTVTSHD